MPNPGLAFQLSKPNSHGRSTVNALPDKQFQEPTTEACSALDRLRALVIAELEEHYGIDRLIRGVPDVPWLQRLLDDRVFAPGQVIGFLALGITFGDVLAKELSLHWVMVTRDGWTEPALRFGDKTLTIHPLRMISSRIEKGEEVRLASLLEWLREDMPRFIKDAR